MAFAAPAWLFVAFVLAWGALVIADSAQFSALSAAGSPQEYVGTALTVQNALGFALTFGSLTLLPAVADAWGWRWVFLLLAPGPLLGALALRPVLPRG